MSDLALPIVFMLVLVLGEALIRHYRHQDKVDWHDVVFNLNSGHIMLWLFRGLEVTCFGYVAAHYSLGWLDNWPKPLLWLFALLAWDFGFYWLHRLHHHLPPLWAVHVVHHQGEHFNLSLGVRNSWYSSLTSIPFFLLLALIGVPLSVFITISILHYSIQLFNHNALTPKLGWLEQILVTPHHHRVHHVKEHSCYNKNFGGSFIWWDKVFGTFARLPDRPVSYGVSGGKSSANPFWASNKPVLRYLHLPWKRPAMTAQFHCSAIMMVIGALLLFSQVVGYVYLYGYGYDDVTSPQVMLFVLLALGAVALGGVSEGQEWSVMAWLLVTLALPAWFIGYLSWAPSYWSVTMTMLALHGITLAISRRRQSVAAMMPHQEQTHD